MSTSDCPKTYPKRLYEEGKCPLQHRSMNHSCHLASLQMVEESVGIDAWESIKESAVGVILRFKDLDYTWSAQAVHHLLTNQLVVDSIHEVWSLIEGQPIRFSLHEFGEITGLNCEPFNIDDKVEVDHKPFFFCHLINGNHWVALEVDFEKKLIHVYDSIQTVVPSNTDLQEECRPFTKMIPLLLNEMVPGRKKSSQQFRISRLKSVPKNEDPGDCGVYALKYIECRAIGCGFEGLSDQCIPAMRIKLAAEIYDEVRGL